MTTLSRYMTSAEKDAMWESWRSGETIAEISRSLGRQAGSIREALCKHGGICPQKRKRSARALTIAEREHIAWGIATQHSVRAIARMLGRSPSTISREVQRNGGYDHYRAHQAEQAMWDRARRPKPCKLAAGKQLCRRVASKLKQNWSPQQIAGWLKRTAPGKPQMQVSHETIYRSLYIQTRGVLKKELMKHLRHKHKLRRTKHAKSENRGAIPDLVSISERPASVEDRALPGHWEGDLIVGSGNSYIATLVERHTRYVMLIKVSDKTTETVVSSLIKHVKRLPCELAKSLTWDRGSELKSHKRFTLATDIAVYFCDPQSPWQRGSNENTNGLLRQYFPKGTDLSVHSQRKLDSIARELNERPRKTLDYEAPADRFAQCVASIN